VRTSKDTRKSSKNVETPKQILKNISVFDNFRQSQNIAQQEIRALGKEIGSETNFESWVDYSIRVQFVTGL